MVVDSKQLQRSLFMAGLRAESKLKSAVRDTAKVTMLVMIRSNQIVTPVPSVSPFKEPPHKIRRNL